MKIYIEPEKIDLIRVNIKKQGFETEHLALENTGLFESYNFFKNLITEQKLPPIISGKRTILEVRESIKGENKRAKSFAFYGLNPIEVKNLIIKTLNKS
jgi:hypothetical protein